MDEGATFHLYTCPNCNSFTNQYKRHGDVEGRSVSDAVQYLNGRGGKGGEFSTRSWSEDYCGNCLHHWNRMEFDVIRLYIDPKSDKSIISRFKRLLGFE